MGDTRKLAEFALNFRLEDCPKEVIQQAKRCTIETIGCALGGAKTPLAQVASKAVGRLGEGGVATIVGFGRRTTQRGQSV